LRDRGANYARKPALRSKHVLADSLAEKKNPKRERGPFGRLGRSSLWATPKIQSGETKLLPSQTKKGRPRTKKGEGETKKGKRGLSFHAYLTKKGKHGLSSDQEETKKGKLETKFRKLENQG